MKILVIGGTQFVGRHFVYAALANGHEITVLHRGHTPIPKDWKVEENLADRETGLDVLDGRTWDACFDSVGYVPRMVQISVDKLKEKVARYLFISTVSVYTFDAEGAKKVKAGPKVDTEEVTGETYGPLKVECEQVVNEAFGEKATIVRPGIVAGSFDPTHRFDYWIERFDRFDEVLVPQLDKPPLQLVDARDLGEFCVKLLEDDRSGTFDAVGEQMTFESMIEVVMSVTAGKPIFASEDWLKQNEVMPWRDLPLALPSDSENKPMMQIDAAASEAVGFTRRSFKETAEDTLQWSRTVDWDTRASGSKVLTKSTWSREKEEALLLKLAAQPGV